MTGTGASSTINQDDVAAILSQLRDEVRARRAVGGSEPHPLERDLQRSLDEIELYRVVSAHWPLIGHTLPQRIVALVNKLVRRYLRWYINPIVEQQNAYNDAVARTLRLLADAYADLAEQIADGGQGIGDRGWGTGDHGRPMSDRPQQNLMSDTASAPVEQIMALVRERAAAEPPARFPDLELRAAEPQLRLRQQVIAHWPLGGATMPQRTVALVNKLVRRYLRWYVNPIVEQQNAANSAIGVALTALIRLDAERRGQSAARRARR